MITVNWKSLPYSYFPYVASLSPGSWIERAFYPVIIKCRDGTELPVELGLKPTSQHKTDRYNNHDCFHDNFTGSVCALPLKRDALGRFKLSGRYYNNIIDISGPCSYTVSLVDTPLSYGQVDIVFTGTRLTLDYLTTALFPDKKVWYKRWYRIAMDILYDEYTMKFTYRRQKGFSEAVNGPDPPAPKMGSWSNWSISDASSKQFRSREIDTAHLLGTMEAFSNIHKPELHDKLYWGRLSQDACDCAKAVSQNMIATLMDVKELPTLIKTMKDILLEKKVTPKTIANAYLTYQYAIRPSIEDGKEIGTAVLGTQRPKMYIDSYVVRSRCTVETVLPGEPAWTTSYNLKCYYLQENDCLAGIFQSIYSWGLLGLENVWDLIPFSFVVDWFWAFGDMLEQQDTRTFCSVLPVTSVIQTRCDRTTIDAGILPYGRDTNLFGSITIKRYGRELCSRLTPPYVELSKPTNPCNHIVEGAAMLISAGKR